MHDYNKLKKMNHEGNYFYIQAKREEKKQEYSIREGNLSIVYDKNVVQSKAKVHFITAKRQLESNLFTTNLFTGFYEDHIVICGNT